MIAFLKRQCLYPEFLRSVAVPVQAVPVQLPHLCRYSLQMLASYDLKLPGLSPSGINKVTLSVTL